MDLIGVYKVKDGHVIISGVSLEVDLMVVDITAYDVILGMDWLAKNRVSIDCYKKEVFTPPFKTSFNFKGTCLGVMPKVILMMKAKKLVHHGAWAILASVVNIEKEETPLAPMPVANEFLDVFPKDLPGIPPSRDVDFGIELEPSTGPISKAPYYMAPAELKTLRYNYTSYWINDLLDTTYLHGVRWCYLLKERIARCACVSVTGS